MDAQLQDIYDIIYTPFWQQSWFLIGAALVGLGFFSILLWYFFFKNQQQKPLTAKEQFEQKLKAIKKQAYEVSEPVLYAQVTTFAKNYLDTFYATECIAKTDEECLAYLKDVTELPAELKKVLMSIFQHATYSKFAQDATHKETVAVLLEALELLIVALP